MIRSAALRIVFCAALAPMMYAAPFRVTFTRLVPPARNLGNVRDIAVVYAIGDDLKVSSFVAYFVEFVAKNGQLHIVDAVDNNRNMASFDGKALKAVHRRHRADAYVGVSLFTCSTTNHTGEIGEKDPDGKRVRTRVQWLDAECTAKVDIRRADGRQILTFMTHGEGTSPRVAAAGEDERDIATEQAARYAALNVADSIVPRVVRESLELDETAPAYDEGVDLMQGDHLAEARILWESRLTKTPHSAALYYNLGVVREALGEIAAAQDAYTNAARLAPQEARYRRELDSFRKRNGLARK